MARQSFVIQRRLPSLSLMALPASLILLARGEGLVVLWRLELRHCIGRLAIGPGRCCAPGRQGPAGPTLVWATLGHLGKLICSLAVWVSTCRLAFVRRCGTRTMVSHITITSIAPFLWFHLVSALPPASRVSESNPIGLVGIALWLRELLAIPWLLQYAVQHSKAVRPPDD